jgi:hypothetical protein
MSSSISLQSSSPVWTLISSHDLSLGSKSSKSKSNESKLEVKEKAPPNKTAEQKFESVEKQKENVQAYKT